MVHHRRRTAQRYVSDMSRVLGFLSGLAFLMLCGCAHHGGTPVIHAENVSLSDLPAPVMRAFHERFPEATIVWAGKFDLGTNADYSIQFVEHGRSLATSIDLSGKVGSVYEPVNTKPIR